MLNAYWRKRLTRYVLRPIAAPFQRLWYWLKRVTAPKDETLDELDSRLW